MDYRAQSRTGSSKQGLRRERRLSPSPAPVRRVGEAPRAGPLAASPASSGGPLRLVATFCRGPGLLDETHRSLPHTSIRELTHAGGCVKVCRHKISEMLFLPWGLPGFQGVGAANRGDNCARITGCVAHPCRHRGAPPVLGRGHRPQMQEGRPCIWQGPPPPGPAAAHCSHARLPAPSIPGKPAVAHSQQEAEHLHSQCFPHRACFRVRTHPLSREPASWLGGVTNPSCHQITQSNLAQRSTCRGAAGSPCHVTTRRSPGPTFQVTRIPFY